ncbi:hypothetical protein ILYODFUR_006650 [Ilyodon furcidens]|uniref:Uncharacterized protein n=1 Tax=Ilyodon furcidens TaxID=33524 RepID=A0ABV0V0V7_9TELE
MVLELFSSVLYLHIIFHLDTHTLLTDSLFGRIPQISNEDFNIPRSRTGQGVIYSPRWCQSSVLGQVRRIQI